MISQDFLEQFQGSVMSKASDSDDKEKNGIFLA